MTEALQCGWEVTYESGNRTLVPIDGVKKPTHPLIVSIEPVYKTQPPAPAPAPVDVQGLINDAVVQSFHSAVGNTRLKYVKKDALTEVAITFAKKHWLGKQRVVPDYTQAARVLAFALHGCQIEELSDEEAETCRRASRSTINEILKVL